MKRPSSSDSLGAARTEGLISMYPPGPDENKFVGRVGSFQSILDGYVEEDEEMMGGDCEEMCSQGAAAGGRAGEKKRRLSVEQVKALEKNFEVENKLEPDRKVQLAQELGLQPRQVAVWFQNRRARWKTKQLERDYGVLKGNYEALKLNHEQLQLDNEALRAEIKALKAKLSGDENSSSHCSIKEEHVEVARGKVKPKKELSTAAEEMLVGEVEGEEDKVGTPALVYKDGSSDSDSSAILNDENSPHHHVGGAGTASPSGPAVSQEYQLQEEQPQYGDLFHGFNCASSSSPPPPSPFHCPNGRGSTRLGFPFCFESQPQLWKVEESGGFDGEEPCSSSFFSDDQVPTLPWYCSDQWDCS